MPQLTTRITPDMVVLVRFNPDSDDQLLEIFNDDDLCPIPTQSLTHLQRETILQAVGVWLLEHGYNPDA